MTSRRRRKKNHLNTLRYLHGALEFFKQFHKLSSITCEIDFSYELSRNTLGYYDIEKNKIKIYFCHIRSRNELVKTLLHELVHYWQAQIVKTLKIVSFIRNEDFCQSFPENRSCLLDAYHSPEFQVKKVLYQNIDTSVIDYWDRPHEMEARQKSQELFTAWNESGKKA